MQKAEEYRKGSDDYQSVEERRGVVEQDGYFFVEEVFFVGGLENRDRRLGEERPPVWEEQLDADVLLDHPVEQKPAEYRRQKPEFEVHEIERFVDLPGGAVAGQVVAPEIGDLEHIPEAIEEDAGVGWAQDQ